MQLDAGQRRILAAVGVVLLVLFSGTAALMRVEGLPFGDALYFGVVTMSTVGYGDVVPSTLASRAFSVVVVLLGLAVLSLVTASLAAIFVEREVEEEERAIERELRQQLLELRRELQALRAELREVLRQLPLVERRVAID